MCTRTKCTRLYSKVYPRQTIHMGTISIFKNAKYILCANSVFRRPSSLLLSPGKLVWDTHGRGCDPGTAFPLLSLSPSLSIHRQSSLSSSPLSIIGRGGAMADWIIGEAGEAGRCLNRIVLPGGDRKEDQATPPPT